MKIQWQNFIKRYVNVDIPTRDGILLRADVYMPAGEGPFPAIVMRSPYLKSMAITPHYSQWGKYYASRGFAFVMCDVRGKGDSDGSFHPFFNELNDGYDTVEWVASQPWCTGDVGMDGNSYNAHTAWMAAKSRAPHLKAMTVSGVPGDLLRHGTHYLNGIKSLYMVLWMFMTNGRTSQIPTDVYGLQKPYEFLPDLLKRCAGASVKDIPDVLGYDGLHWVESLDHPWDDGFWAETQVRGSMRGSCVAAMHISGWFDNCLPGTIDGFNVLREEGDCPNDQYLVIGPWPHAACVAPIRQVGDLDFGDNAILDMLGLKVQFFRRYLSGNGNFMQSNTQIFDMGIQDWHSGDDFLPVQEQIRYVTGEGIAEKSGSALTYAYSPQDPTPATIVLSPVDISSVAQRRDVGTFQSTVFEDPLCVSGEVQLHLNISVDAQDVDLVATIADLFPDGRMLPLSMKGLKLGYRDSLETGVPIPQGEAFEVLVRMPYLHNTFQLGHRLVLLLQSAAFPMYVPASYPAQVTVHGNSRIVIPISE